MRSSLTSGKHARVLKKSGAKVLKRIASAFSTSRHKSYLTWINSYSYCRLGYSNNYVSSRCCHFKVVPERIRSLNLNFKDGFRSRGNSRKQMTPPASCHFLPPPEKAGHPGKFNNRNNYNRSMRYPPRQGPLSNCSYL